MAPPMHSKKGLQKIAGISFPFIHHAYCLVGEISRSKEILENFLEKGAGIAIRGNPDYFFAEFPTLTIEEARKIRDMEEGRAWGENDRVFAIAAHSMTGEAQNSLLKILEEPAENTRLFLLIESVKMLLPTVRSRLFITAVAAEAGEENNVAVGFMKASIPERLKMVKSFTDELSEGNKTKTDLVRFLHDVEKILHQKIEPKKSEHIRGLEALLQAERELSGRSPSVKLLFEHLALTLPR